MGNCVQKGCKRISKAVEEDQKFISIMKVDGKMLEYSAPLFVKDVVADYGCHTVVEPQDINQQLPLGYELLPGHKYCLIPEEKSTNVKEEEMIKVETKEMDKSKGGVVRLKIVIKKQELGELLVGNKGMSLEDLVLQIQSKCHSPRSGLEDSSPKSNSSGWRPSLDSIPELHDVVA